jgi:hypothetical protein
MSRVIRCQRLAAVGANLLDVAATCEIANADRCPAYFSHQQSQPTACVGATIAL